MSTTEIAVRQQGAVAHHQPMSRAELVSVLGSSLYPGAAPKSIELVLGYCEAKGLNPMQKPVHIVPMWDSKTREMRDVIMEGINSYRIAAERSGMFAGMSEPIYGPMLERTFQPAKDKGAPFKMAYPEWCRVTVQRIVAGQPRDFTAVEYWDENYATAGKDGDAPNAMWRKRPRGQLSKCTQAQALRIAFPELAGAPTAEELEGKSIDAATIVDMTDAIEQPSPELLAAAREAAGKGRDAFASWWKDKTNGGQTTEPERVLLKPYLAELATAVSAFEDAKKPAAEIVVGAAEAGDASGSAPAAEAGAAETAGGAQPEAERQTMPTTGGADNGTVDPFVAALDRAPAIASRAEGLSEADEAAPKGKGRR